MERKASNRVLFLRRRPLTWETRCCTWENFSTTMSLSVLVLKGSHTRLISFLAKSTSMTCSALSFRLARSSFASWRSSSGVLPRFTVPAIGWVMMRWVSGSRLARSSGEAPTRWKSEHDI